MFAQIAQAGLQIGGALYGMHQAGKAADDASEAAIRAADARTDALNKAGDTRRAGINQSVGYLKPWEESGRGGQKLLNDALGINGPDAQRAFFSGFQNDPGFDAMQKTGLNTVEQGATARGGLYSGATMKALQDYGMKLQQSVFSDRMNRLGEVGKMGATSATNMATVTNSGYKDLADFEAAKGVSDASGIMGASNAQQQGVQNQLSMLGYGMGQMKQPLNDLFGSLGKTGAGFSSGIPQGAGLGGYAGSW